MEKKKKEAIMNSTTFEELLDAEYGKRGSEEREKFEVDSKAYGASVIPTTKKSV